MLATRYATRMAQPARIVRAVQPLARTIETKPVLSAMKFQTAIRQLHMRPTQMMRMQQTARMMRPVPKEEHSAHTISQRLRTLKKIPPELIPLGIVLAVAVVFAGYSLIAKLFSDKTLRLTRSSAADH